MPIPVVSIAQMREWEKNSWAKGQSESEVIRRVGRAVADCATRLTRTGDLIIALAGRGNNGADARAALEHFDERRLDILELRDPRTDVNELETILASRPALLIDGLFGIGLNRPLDDGWCDVIRRINAAKLSVLSVDIPSGLNADTGEPEGAAIEASVTLTVGAPKSGLLKKSSWRYAGRVELANDVGLGPCPVTTDLRWTLPSDFEKFPPHRTAASHKGDFGHLAILAGSPGYHGAAVLAARGAQRARPGLITLITHESSYQPCAAQSQAVMVHSWPAGFQEGISAVLAGPGLAGISESSEIRRRVVSLWREADTPVIVDASALGWLQPGRIPEGVVRVITPHPGEAARLLGTTSAAIQADRREALRALSKKFGGCCVVLKGHQTLVGVADEPVFVNSSGNPGLAQGGSGDVLAGFIAGFLAQPSLREDPLKAIRYAVWQHGAAADALERSGRSWIIEELLDELGGKRCSLV